jgi:hypothetical protein
MNARQEYAYQTAAYRYSEFWEGAGKMYLPIVRGLTRKALGAVGVGMVVIWIKTLKIASQNCHLISEKKVLR